MTDKSDVVGRLRARADEQERNNSYPVDRALDREAADEIDRLTAALASERERAEKAEDRAKEAWGLSLGWARAHDLLLGWIQDRPSVFAEYLASPAKIEYPDPAKSKALGAERDALARRVTELEGALASGMSALINDVRAFHEACGVPVGETPAIVAERVQLRRSILAEEWRETDEAMQRGDLVEVADGLADVIYVAIGTALEFGIPLDRVWAEVQRSNMAKRDPSTGKVRRRDDGKILKPDGWTPPDIARALIPAKED